MAIPPVSIVSPDLLEPARVAAAQVSADVASDVSESAVRVALAEYGEATARETARRIQAAIKSAGWVVAIGSLLWSMAQTVAVKTIGAILTICGVAILAVIFYSTSQ